MSSAKSFEFEDRAIDKLFIKNKKKTKELIFTSAHDEKGPFKTSLCFLQSKRLIWYSIGSRYYVLF